MAETETLTETETQTQPEPDNWPDGHPPSDLDLRAKVHEAPLAAGAKRFGAGKLRGANGLVRRRKL